MSILGQSTGVQSIGSTGYVMLLIDGLKLLIPQDQIVALEMTTDMNASKAGALVAGYFQFKNKSWPIFRFSKSLTLTSSVGLDYRFCILLQTGSTFFGILSKQALLLKAEDVISQPLPESMSMTNSPISALTIYDGDVCCVSSAEQLAGLLPLR